MKETAASQFGIERHAQVQTIDGIVFEFQPEHLGCDKCWNWADSAYAHSAAFGGTFGAFGDREPDDEPFGRPSHGIHVTKVAD